MTKSIERCRDQQPNFVKAQVNDIVLEPFPGDAPKLNPVEYLLGYAKQQTALPLSCIYVEFSTYIQIDIKFPSKPMNPRMRL